MLIVLLVFATSLACLGAHSPPQNNIPDLSSYGDAERAVGEFLNLNFGWGSTNRRMKFPRDNIFLNVEQAKRVVGILEEVIYRNKGELIVTVQGGFGINEDHYTIEVVNISKRRVTPSMKEFLAKHMPPNTVIAEISDYEDKYRSVCYFLVKYGIRYQYSIDFDVLEEETYGRRN